uniref:VQ domain-containing protein n=1 Tax=Leersia perrieri TaxID=77586 RepID=A0A0D9XH69_9ORYZ
MEKQQQQEHPSPARPHWRRRDPSEAEVYVVHPTQFRSVVQHLTGAAAAATAAQRGSGGGTSVDTSKNNNGSGRGMTLGQMHQECMAWAAQDDQHH